MCAAKTALISGGTNGIGKAIALRLLKDGFNVAVFSRDAKKCAAFEKELSGGFESSRFLVMKGDVADQKSIQGVVKSALGKFGNIDILINNAGFGYFSECDKFDLQRFNDMIGTNLVGVASMTSLVVPGMKERESGQIINIVSIAGKSAYAQGEFYSATKFGALGYSQGIRAELRGFGIKVCTVCPGMVRTSFFAKGELERRRKLTGMSPAMLEAEDIASTVSLVCNQPGRSDIQDMTIMPF